MASPPCPAEHSHWFVSELNSAFATQTQESESVAVASFPPLEIEAPRGQEVHCSLPTSPLNAEDPHGLQPTLADVASPPYPAEHSHWFVSEFNSAFAPQTQESESVAVASFPPSEIEAPAGQGVHSVFPTSLLKALAPQGVQEKMPPATFS